MTAEELLSHLRERDIRLWAENGKLKLSAPKDVLTPELRGELSDRKAEILAALKREPASPNGSIGSSIHSLLAPAPIRAAQQSGDLPLSPVQQRFWILQQLQPESTAYTIPAAVRLTGPQKEEALSKSVFEILLRHDCLRSSFTEKDGVISRIVHPANVVNIESVDLRLLPAGKRTEVCNERIAEALRRPFKLEVPPLLRVLLMRIADEEQVLFLSVHHIVFDGWSAGVFMTELTTLYNALAADRLAELPAPEIQYSDYVQWYNEQRAAGKFEAQRQYWRTQLSGKLPILELPTDRPRPAQPSGRGTHSMIRLPKEQAENLLTLSRRHGATLFMTLLSAFKILLHRFTGQNDVIVGTPIAGRTQSQVEGLIGPFLNTLALRSRFERGLRFTELLAQVREITLEAYSNQDVPFETVLEDINAERSTAHSNVFQVMFVLQNTPQSTRGFDGLTFTPLEIPSQTTKFDWNLHVIETDTDLICALQYSTDLFDQNRITEVLAQYTALLDQVCLQPDLPVERYSLLTPGFRARVPDPNIPLEFRAYESVHQRFEKQAQRFPDRIAVSDPEGSWTYAEIERLSAGLAAWLNARGVNSGDVVTIYAHRGAQLVLALLGVLRAGAAFCILDPAYPAVRLAQNLRTARPKAAIHITGAGSQPENFRSLLDELVQDRQLELPLRGELRQSAEATTQPFSAGETKPGKLAYVTFTSGTTGQPKCISGTHDPLSHFIDWHCSEFGLTDQDRFSLLSGLSHDPLLRDIFTPLWLGATLWIPNPDKFLEPGYLVEWMQEKRITVSHLTPALGALIAESATTPLQGLRRLFFGGDFLTSNIASRARRLAPAAQIVNFYGTTETPQAMAWHPIDLPSLIGSEAQGSRGFGALPIGQAIPGVQILILNQEGVQAGASEEGEIFIRTPYLALGYANDDELTAARFLTNPFTGDKTDRLYRTGDLGRYRTDGVVELIGRADRQVKIRGYRVELGEIEAALAGYDGLRQCVVITREEPSSSQLIAYLAPRGAVQPTSHELRSYLLTILPDYMVPAAFVFLDTLPLTPNGKIDRTALPIPSGDLFGRATGTYVAPRNQVETLMAEIWAEVLGIKKIGIFEHFFELGGHSLSATKLISRLNAAFHLELPLKSLFVEPTIAALSALIRYNDLTQSYQYVGEAYRWKCLVPAQPKGSKIPLFLVAGYMGANDTLRVLSNLIPHLGLDQPVYGLQPRWLDGQSDRYASTEEIANEFVAEIRVFQPNGPYILGGDCVGGVIALEMARTLIRRGEKVALLVLLDTERPTILRDFAADLRMAWRRAQHIGSTLGQLLSCSFSQKIQLVQNLFRRKVKALHPQKFGESAADRNYRLRVDYRRMLYRHRVKKYPGKIVLILNEQHHRLDKDAGWGGAADQGLEIHVTPGDHRTRFVLYGKEMSEILSSCLRWANAGAASPSPRNDRTV